MPLLASPSAVMFNEGLDPGVRVFLDDRTQDMATVCFTERAAAYCWVRLDRTGKRVRVESWRLGELD